MKFEPRFLLAGLAALLMAVPAQAREAIHAVGSSTVFPFIATAAEQFGRNSDFLTPIVESTGTGGGFKLFCGGVGPHYPDIANASRAIKSSELEECARNGVHDPLELAIGFDGIVLASRHDAQRLNLTIRELFLALALKVPGADGKLVDNPYATWTDINPALPEWPITVYGPPPTSGTRDAFVELVMEVACEEFPEFEAAYPDKDGRKKKCHLLREDGGFIDAGENDNMIVQKLVGDPKALGIFGYSFLEQNQSLVQGSEIGGVAPTFDAILNGDYKVARSLFVYIKREHVGFIPGMRELVAELTGENALAEDGYLPVKGLIPPTAVQRDALRQRAGNL